MTRQVSKEAIDALNAWPDAKLSDIVAAFGFMKANATFAAIPHAEQLQLGYLGNGICPWRIIDRGAEPGAGTANVAFTLRSSTTAGLCIEMEAYGKAFRGLGEIRDKGTAPDLIADGRRRPRTNIHDQ
jgi:hypothetical protein